MARETKGDRYQSWWAAQGYSKEPGTSIPEGESAWFRPQSTPTPEHELLRDETDEQRGGPVPISIAPTPSTDPSNPRTAAMGYDPDTQVLRVEWADGGTAYNYYDVTKEEWRGIRRVKSPGKFINRRLNGKLYGPAE
jgi:KTSC domain